MKPDRMGRLRAVALLCIAGQLCSCSVISARRRSESAWGAEYIGTYCAATELKEFAAPELLWVFPFGLVNLASSAIVDTLLLPIDLAHDTAENPYGACKEEDD